MGAITCRVMRRLNQPTNYHLDFQLMASFVCAYVAYYVAAALVGVSGVLSCCCAGFTLSIFAPVRVLQDEKFHQIWSYAEWACNTLIFLLAGIIGGGRSASVITPTKFGFLVLMFIALTITRGMMAFMMQPFLNMFGAEKITFNETLFITFAGLRGALCIALALQGAQNATDNGNDELGKELFFMIVGLASFTLLFNGSTAAWVLLKLELVEDPNAPISPQLQQVLERIRTFISLLLKEEVEKMSSELGDYDEKELSQLCEFLYQDSNRAKSAAYMGMSSLRLSLLSKALSQENNETTTNNKNNNKKNDRMSEDEQDTDEARDVEGSGGGGEGGRGSATSDSGNATGDNSYRWDKSGKASMRVSGSLAVDRDLLYYTRTTFLNVVRARYSEAVHSGKMSSTSTPTRILNYSLDVALDRVHFGMKDWDVILTLLQPNKTMLTLFQWIDDLAYFTCNRYPGLVSWLEVKVERIAIYVITNYISAHEYAQSKIHYFLGGPVNKEYDIAAPEHNRVMQESKELVNYFISKGILLFLISFVFIYLGGKSERTPENHQKRRSSEGLHSSCGENRVNQTSGNIATYCSRWNSFGEECGEFI
jgi:hypothetical protein